ncbi:plasmid mobilization relaxosome protein MobC [Burkholderia sp. IDO3]|uniref:plasmid mobilization protein n=1 Tax=Burkholderia sp. IDO3 TaxID=1705310 RepID=UPI000BBA735F|nr:plasmid mobilization relaxosome protein MobC [Burkholderia sp. IDO3]AXK66456.1 plasmid mobilization relaxosome protein MobC [Burkholderia sp. IDO3]PCD59027.1 plasmid mobilization relaxosome protein MobC [Burkholderia sp. IDO3]
MEQQQHEAFASLIKKQAGQSGIDGNIHRRDRHIDVRVSPVEREKIGQRALEAGYGNLAQYLRETALVGPASLSDTHIAWLQAINFIGNNVAEIATLLRDRQQPDDDMLVALLQLQECAEYVWREVKQGRGTGNA